MKKPLAVLSALICGCLVPSFAGDGVPDFKLPDLDGKPVQLRALLQKGPVLIDFWATWCKPCVKYFPVLQGWHEKYGAAGLTIVSINEDGPRSLAKVKPFTRSLKIGFTVLVDENSDVMRLLRVQNLPTSLLIAPDGSVVARHTGYSEESTKATEAKIVELLQKISESRSGSEQDSPLEPKK
jgi:thiol-disulfide isomerase/thioredoxin